jgi:hypothetical protein
MVVMLGPRQLHHILKRYELDVSHLNMRRLPPGGNQDCKYTTRIHRTSLVNEMEWDGFIPTPFAIGEPAPNGSILVCKIYKVPPVYIANCSARIYYVFGSANMTRACVNLGVHEHPVKVGEDQGQ